jgi:hypothetical protein
MQHLRLAMSLLVALVVLLGTESQAQSTCDNPFSGENVQFNVEYWEKTDFCNHSVPYSEIISGGPPPDGIPPIDNPVFESIAAAGEWLQPQSPVIALEIDGDARAYPMAVLIWHEIANDVVGDVPVAVTFCPLCNSAVVFDRRVDDVTLRFGVSGNLRKSDLIMWDNVTQSWWQQFTGEAIVGAYTGTQLTLLPSLVVSFAEFSAQYPEGQVLSRETSHERDYGSNPYIDYDSSESPFLYFGELDDRLPATARILGGLVGGEAVAYTFEGLSRARVFNDTVGDIEVVAFWQPGATSALDQRSIDESRDVGMAVLYSREVNGEVLTFSLSDDGSIQDAQTGSTWNVFGTATAGELEGEQLQQQLAFPHFWFAWVAFRPETRLVE